MNRSGIKRGLAVAAISAMTLTGVSLSVGVAHADPINNVGGITWEAPTVATTAVSTSGADSKVHLVLTAPAATSTIAVTVSTNGGAPNISNVAVDTLSRNARGDFEIDWAPPANLMNRNVIFTATDTTTNAAVASSAVTIGTANAAEINRSNDPLGVFKDTAGGGHYYTAISGTANKDSGPGNTHRVDVRAVRPNSGPGNLYNVSGGNFGGALDLGTTPYNFSNVQDQLLVRSTQEDNLVQDAAAFNVYKQTISGITATPDQNPVPVGDTTEVTIKVVDQFGKPVAGVNVRRTTGLGAGIGRTDANGEVVDDGFLGFGLGVGSYSWYADENSNGNYNNGVEYLTSQTITDYVPAVNAATASSSLGDAIDIQQALNAAPAHKPVLQLSTKDQQGNPIQSTGVIYRWKFTPFAGSGLSAQTSADINKTTNGAGQVDLGFSPNGLPQLAESNQNDAGGSYELTGYVNTDGTPGQGPTDLVITPHTFKIGNAVVSYDGATRQIAQAGDAAVTVKGHVALDDGTKLTQPAGKNLDLSWSHGSLSSVDGNPVPGSATESILAVTQPAGTVRSTNTQAVATTDANGDFSVNLTSTAATVNEKGGSLTATGENGIEQLGTNTNGSQDVDFLVHTGVAHVNTVSLGNFYNVASPGRPVEYRTQVTNQNGDTLSNTEVTVKTDHGFISKLDSSNDLIHRSSTLGDDAGLWANDGASTTLKTDANGYVYFAVAIETDAGFDDDGRVEATVDASAGTPVVNAAPVKTTFHTDYAAPGVPGTGPVNPGSVSLTFATNQNQSNGFDNDGVANLPDAAANRAVNLELVATDSFGNRVLVPVNVTDDTSKVNVSSTNGGLSQFTVKDNVDSAIVAEQPVGSNVDAVQNITAEWNAGTRKWVDTDDLTDGVQLGTQGGTTTLNSAKTINWYAIDYAHGTYTLTRSGADTQPVNSTVTETYSAKDQKGQPIWGLTVEFFRGGPDTNQNGDPNPHPFNVTTQQAGVAAYVFKAVTAGTASITAVPYDSHGLPLGVGEASDTVKFPGATTPPPVQVAINATLTAGNNVKGNDVLRVKAPVAAYGAKVTYYKFVKGKKVLLGYGSIHADGTASATIPDAAKKGLVYYSVTVGATSKTKADVSNTASTR